MKELILYDTYGCYAMTELACFIYGFMVHLITWIVEVVLNSTLWEDGSWGDSGNGGCIEYLGWGCK